MIETEQSTNNLPTGVSIESASYMENNNIVENVNKSSFSDKNDIMKNTLQSYFLKTNYQLEEITTDSNEQDSNEPDQLFDQDVNEEEDFEIPAFLRKQKF